MDNPIRVIAMLIITYLPLMCGVSCRYVSDRMPDERISETFLRMSYVLILFGAVRIFIPEVCNMLGGHLL